MNTKLKEQKINKKGAQAYNENKKVKKCLISIKKPFIAKNQFSLVKTLNDEQINEFFQKKDTGDNREWLRALDALIVKKIKSKDYDSIVYIEPMPPAIRELCVFNKDQVKLLRQ